MSSSTNYCEVLLAAIQSRHACEALHVNSLSVVEEVEGRVIWSGTVEEYELIDHSTAKRCYAWVEDPARAEFVLVLQKGLVISPESAVKAWLATRPVTIHPV